MYHLKSCRRRGGGGGGEGACVGVRKSLHHIYPKGQEKSRTRFTRCDCAAPTAGIYAARCTRGITCGNEMLHHIFLKLNRL